MFKIKCENVYSDIVHNGRRNSPVRRQSKEFVAPTKVGGHCHNQFTDNSERQIPPRMQLYSSGISHRETASRRLGCNAGSWRLHRRRLHFLSDLTGDGNIVGFCETHIFVGCNNESGISRSAQTAIDDFPYSTGWRVDQHPRFITDLTGDGKADVLGYGGAGLLHVSLNRGNGTFGPMNLALNDCGRDRTRSNSGFAPSDVRWPGVLVCQSSPGLGDRSSEPSGSQVAL